MAIPRSRVARLLTDAEMELFNASVDRATKDLPAKRLDAKVKRARNLRDKYRDLYKRQTRELRGRKVGKAPRAGKPNERTAQKAQVFDEVLERFRKHAERRKTADKRRPEAKRKAAGKGKRAAGRKTGPRAASGKAAAKPTPRRKAAPKVPVRSTAALVERKRAAQARQRAARAMDVSPKAPSHGPPAGGTGEESSQVLGDPARFDIAGAAAIQGHVGSAARRSQARRDRRG